MYQLELQPVVAEAHQNVLKLRRSVNDRKVVLDRDLRVEIALLSAVDKNLLRCIFFPRALDARYVYQATFSLNSPLPVHTLHRAF